MKPEIFRGDASGIHWAVYNVRRKMRFLRPGATIWEEHERAVTVAAYKQFWPRDYHLTPVERAVLLQNRPLSGSTSTKVKPNRQPSGYTTARKKVKDQIVDCRKQSKRFHRARKFALAYKLDVQVETLWWVLDDVLQEKV